MSAAIGRQKKLITNIMVYAALIVLGFIMLYPLLMIVNISLKSFDEFLRDPVGIVKKPFFENYATVWQEFNMLNRTFTTVWITAASVLLGMVTAIYAAFPISRKLYKGSGKVYTLILISMFFPGSIVATVMILKEVLFVYGSPLSLVLIWGFGGLQLNIFMLVNFIKTVPRDLDEAAYIDGCGYYRYILKIAAPLMTPIIMTLIMLKVIGCWNDFLGPYIYVTDDRFRTLSTGLYTYMGQYSSKWQLYTAAVFIVATPMILIYLFCQRFIISGMMSGAIKG